MKKTFWKDGDYSAICDVCGFKFKASKLKERWDGLKVCKEDWEVRHPQEFLRVIPESNKLNWTRPEPEDTFVVICTLFNVQGIAGIGVAGCARAGYIL